MILRADLVRRLIAVNAGSSPDDLHALEREYRVSERLLVYGSLAPGEPNHHIVAPVGGTWTRGSVRGDLHATGWGMTLGYPALRWREDAEEVAVHVLTASGLPKFWPELDAFEGDEYRRLLVPVSLPGGGLTVGYLYALAGDPPA